ncbi:MAG TPA: hypothetical protein VJ867_13480 [Gemmatimonadaceae bacterium]|nr:hypothetical protein [Gemmatimonadaceae bacterium]
MTDIGRSRRAWRRSFFILLGVAVVLVGGLLIAVADKKVSYAEQGPSAASADLEVVARLLPAQQPAPSRADVLRLLRRQNPKARIFATDSTLMIGRLTFHFSRTGRLDRVDHPDLPGSP